MGCASSNPLVEGGKAFVQTAKESAQEIATKGDEVIHNVGESAKDGIENVKEKIGSVVESAEDSVQNAVHKIGEAFNSKKSEAENSINKIENNVEETVNKVQENAKETFSETETIIANEKDKLTDHAKEAEETIKDSMSSTLKNTTEALQDKKQEIFSRAQSLEDSASSAISYLNDETEKIKNQAVDTIKTEHEALAADFTTAKEMAFEKVDSTKKNISEDLNKIDSTLKDALHIEDVDSNFDSILNEIENIDQKELKRLPTPIPAPLEIFQKKEKPTFWESAADAHFGKPKLKESVTVEISDSDLEAEVGSQHNENELEMDYVHINRPQSYGNNEIKKKTALFEHSHSLH